MKRTLCILPLLPFVLSSLFLLTSCEETRHTRTEYGYFDTVITLSGYGMSKEEFDTAAEEVFATLSRFHTLTDIYKEARGTLYELNEKAGVAPVTLDETLIDFLLFAKDIAALLDGTVNPMMGSVLRLWHDARENEALPEEEALRTAAAHVSLDALIIDRAASTAFITDRDASIDVGALAKGYAAEMAADALRESQNSGYLLDAGGNVVCVGDKSATPFTVGIRHPVNTQSLIKKAHVSNASLVTSGSYLRYVTVGGKSYHHIIDPETLYPAEGLLSVTVHAPDSAVADALSTALFIVGIGGADALLSRFDGASAFFVNSDGTTVTTDGFPSA